MTFLISQDNRIKRLISGGVVIKEVALPLMKLKQLFYAGEKGVLLDPSTAGTLYQTTAMTTPSLPGDPVGVALDQSKWGGVSLNAAGATTADKLAPVLGAELATNNSDSQTIKPSTVVETSTGASVVAGNRYAISFTVSTDTTNDYELRFRSAGGASDWTSSVYRSVDVPGQFLFSHVFGSSGLVNLRHFSGPAGSGAITLNNISVRLLPGNHATQATAAKRPTYGIHPFGGRRNLLTQTENFADAAWLTQGGSFSATGVDGFQEFTEDSATSQHRLFRSGLSVISGNSYTLQSRVKYVSRQWVFLSVFDGSTTITAWFDVLNGVKGTALGSPDSYTITEVSPSVYDIKLTITAGTTTSSANIQVGAQFVGGQTANWTANGSVTGFGRYQFEKSATATDYQKVVTQYEVTETGVSSVHYLSFDGVDDALATPSIDFTATDEMTVFAGVRKLSDAAVANLLELGRNEANTFLINAPLSTGAKDYGALSRGSLVSSAESGAFPAPASNVVSLLAKIGSDEITLRIDGVGFSSAGDQGDGNYSNRPIHIGAQQGSARFLHGHLYGLTVRGKTTTTAEIDRAEKITAKLTGVTL